MAEPRFLQIHTLSAYAAALLNRDDSGLAKRLPYGEALRTRVSSQCLKRHWRIATTPHSLDAIDGAQAAYRSRELVTRKVFAPLRQQFPADVADALEPQFQMAVYGDKGTDRKTRQTLLFGDPEIKWLTAEAGAPRPGCTGKRKGRRSCRNGMAEDFPREYQDHAGKRRFAGGTGFRAIRTHGHVRSRGEHHRTRPRGPRLHCPCRGAGKRLLHRG